MNTGKLVGSILAGVAVGFLAGLLLAPEKGENLRNTIAKKGEDTLNEAKDKLNEMFVNLSNKLKSAEAEATELYEKGKNEVKANIS